MQTLRIDENHLPQKNRPKVVIKDNDSFVFSIYEIDCSFKGTLSVTIQTEHNVGLILSKESRSAMAEEYEIF